jgi:serine/threonine protein phosphatase 1
VDRGPDSKGVIDYLLEKKRTHKLVHLMGNHEIQMISPDLSPKKARHGSEFS